MRDTLGRDVATERRACRVLGQARNTQRRKACVADDLAIDVARKLTSEDVLERLSDLFVRRDVPDQIRSDNGSEFTAKRVRERLEGVGVKTLFIEPGSP